MGEYDLVVIGGGPGGVSAAVRAAQLGLNVAVVEERGLGGECTLYGCIPVKALLFYASASMLVSRLSHVELDTGGAFREARRLASELSKGISTLLERYGVHVYHGRGVIEEPGAVRVEGNEGTVRLSYRSLLLAPGSVPYTPPGLEPDGVVVHDNRSVLENPPQRGERLLIIGGGPVGVEYAAVFARLGVEVTLVEALPRLLPGFDRELSPYTTRLLRRLDVDVATGCPVEQLEKKEGRVAARLCGGRLEVFDYALVAVGRRPATRGIGLEKLGVKLDDKGYIKTDDTMRTTAPHVYAVGDATGPPLLAHKAVRQALVAAENIAAGTTVARYKPKAVPMAVYLGMVEAVQVGVTLSEARRQGLGTAKVRLGWSSHAHLAGAADGFAAVVYDPETRRVLGYEAAAPNAAEQAAIATLAIEAGMTLEQLAKTVYPHPSTSEILYETALAALDKPLNYHKHKPTH